MKSTLDLMCRSLLANIEQQLRTIDSNPAALGEIQGIRGELELLPLAARVARRLSGHLSNAQRYLESHERGAAGYELQLLAIALRTEAPGREV